MPRQTGLNKSVQCTQLNTTAKLLLLAHAYGAQYRRQWRKVQLGIDAQMLEIRAIEVTNNSVADAPMLPYLFVSAAQCR